MIAKDISKLLEATGMDTSSTLLFTYTESCPVSGGIARLNNNIVVCNPPNGEVGTESSVADARAIFDMFTDNNGVFYPQKKPEE